MNDPGFAITVEERRRLLEANASAARFFRAELTRSTGGWQLDYLKDAGVAEVLSADSAWRVGYAPDSPTSLVKHLLSEKFDRPTMVRTGLVILTGDGDLVDRYRDQLVIAARDARLLSTGFIGIGQDGRAQPLGSDGAIHQPSNALVGIEEQLDLLRSGAVPVIVNDPIDAIAVSIMSRQMDGQWAGIPVCGSGLSTAQARLLRRFSMGDKVIVVLNGDEHHQKLSAGYLLDLALYYDKIRAVMLPCSPRALAAAESAPEIMNNLLTTARPMMTFRFGGSVAADFIPNPEAPDRDPYL